MDKLSSAMKVKAQETLTTIQKMLANRTAAMQVLDQMDEFNVNSSKLQKQTIDSMSNEIEQLKNMEKINTALKINMAKDFVEKIKKAIEQI